MLFLNVLYFPYYSPSSNLKTVSTGNSNTLLIFIAKGSDAIYLPCSIEIIVCLVTPTFLAKSS